MRKKLILNSDLYTKINEVINADGSFVADDRLQNPNAVTTSLAVGGDEMPITTDYEGHTVSGAFDYLRALVTPNISYIRENDENINNIEYDSLSDTVKVAYNGLKSALSFSDDGMQNLYIDFLISDLNKLKNG